MKKCCKCKNELDDCCFAKNKSQRDGLQTTCKECSKGRKQTAEYKKAYKTKTKKLVFEHYSAGEICCSKCGFDNICALSIDHINGDGANHRRSISDRYHVGSDTFYRWLVKKDFPEGFQVLCMNCQWIKRHESDGFQCNVLPS